MNRRVWAATSCERPDEQLRVYVALQGDGRHLQSGDPALGARRERRDVRVRQLERHGLVEERCRFIRSKTQVFLAQFRELPLRAQSGQGQGQRRFSTRCEGDVHLRRQVIDQVGQCLVHRLAGDQVVVVQHQQQGFQILGNVVEQRAQDGLGRWRRRGLQQRPRACSDAGIDARIDASTDVGIDGLHRGHHIGQKLLQVPLALVQRDPHASSTATRRPLN